MNNEKELTIIKNFLSLHKKDLFSISQLCECLNYVSDNKKYQEEDCVTILNCYNNDKKIKKDSYIGYDFFDCIRYKKENIDDNTVNDLVKSVDNGKNINGFITFIKYGYKKHIVISIILFIFILFFPNFFLMPCLFFFILMVDQIHPLKNNRLIIPLFIGVYPIIYGVFNYNEYIAREFVFISWFNINLFDSRIDLSYLNYLVVCLDVLLVSFIMFLKSIYDSDKKKFTVMIISFHITLVMTLAYFFLKKYFTFDLFTPFYFGLCFLFIVHNLTKSIDYSIILIYCFFCFSAFVVFSSLDPIVEHYYDSINLKNEDTCSNIDKNFLIIKNSKKLGFVVIDSQRFEFKDVLRYIHFNDSKKIDNNYDFEIKAPYLFSSSYTYKVIKKTYDTSDNKGLDEELISDNYKISSIINSYLKLETKNRFFYYKCE